MNLNLKKKKKRIQNENLHLSPWLKETLKLFRALVHMQTRNRGNSQPYVTC